MSLIAVAVFWLACGGSAKAQLTVQVGVSHSANEWALHMSVDGPDITGVRFWRTSHPEDFFTFPDTNHWGAGGYDFLEDLNGQWGDQEYDLEIQRTDGTSVYRFTLNAADASWFPAVPVLQPVNEPVSGDTLFEWTWSGTADAKIFEYVLFDLGGQPFYWQQFVTFSGDPDFDSLQQSVSFPEDISSATVRINYANVVWGQLVSNWTLTSGDDVASDPLFYVSSYDQKTVQFVPEPASVTLLAVGTAFFAGIRWWGRRSLPATPRPGRFDPRAEASKGRRLPGAHNLTVGQRQNNRPASGTSQGLLWGMVRPPAWAG